MATQLSNIPPFPALSDRASGTYNSKAYEFGVHMDQVFEPEINAIVQEVNSAANSAQQAIAAGDAALGAANFKGLWLGKTGAMNMPATVSHKNMLWLLTQNLPTVQTQEPGVSAFWVPDRSLALQHAVALSF